jgi:hypothetical protein
VPKPNVITLFRAGANNGDSIKGILHFPELLSSSSCRNISTLPETSLLDDLPKTAYAQTHVIGFAPWTPECNTEFLDRARDDRADIRGFFFYTLDFIDAIPNAKNDYWNGLKLRNYNFPIYGMRGREGVFLMDHYTQYASNKSLLNDIHNTTGRARIFIEVDTGDAAPLPGLWLFLLVVLAVLICVIGLTSLSMHLLQYRRRRSLRRRVMAGEVDLEALGIKRLTVPRKILEKLPLRTFVADKDDGGVSCCICLEDLIPDATTVRELPCKHIYHPGCIDGFLETQSSLCPLCKASVLPKGYVPEQLTNHTVRRERMLRRQRERQARGAAPRDQTPRWLLGVSTIIWGDVATRTAAARQNVEMRNRNRPRPPRPPRPRSGPGGEDEAVAAQRGGKCEPPTNYYYAGDYVLIDTIVRRAMRAVFPGFN